MSFLAYTADVAIVVTYFVMNRTGRPHAFNLANAVGAIPLAATEVVAHAWPLLVLTSFFGAIGAYGVLRDVPVVPQA